MTDWSLTLTLAQSAPLSGRLAFAAVFALLLIWLLVVPSSHLMEEDRSMAWWKRSRTWAVIVATSQLLVYLLWN